MEQANQRSHSYSKKRKEPSAPENPFRGIFTRSRSQIYLHCNRSGRFRSDSSCHGTQYSDLFCLLALNKKRRTAPWSSVKDLRPSRVSSTGEENEDVKVFEGKIEGFGDGVSRSAVDLQPKTSNSDCFGKDGSIGKVFDDLKAIGDIGEVEMEQQENIEDRSVATTPPDAEILRNKVEYESHNTEHVHRSNTQNDGHGEEVFGGANDKQNRVDGPVKSILTRGVRGKLFKTPGSFSYRRLLPYLMDISKDKPSVQKIGQSARIESGLEQKLFQPVSASQSQVIKEKPNPENSPGESCADDLHGNESQSISLLGITESSIPNGSTIDLSDNAGIEKVNAGVPSEILNSDNSSIGSPVALKNTNLDRCDENSVKSDDTKLMETRKSESHDNNFACKTQNLDHMDSSQSSEGGDVRDYFDDAKQSDGSRVIKKHDCGAQNQCHPVSNAQGDDKLRGGCDGDGSILDQIGRSNKQIFQTTPPGDGVSLQSESENHVFGNPLTRNIHCKNVSVQDSRISSSPKCKMIKMFEVRSSFNYRRLLPFLTNIIEDESGACRGGTKVEKISEQNPLPKYSASNSDETTNEESTGASVLQMPRLSDGICSSINHQSALPFPEQVMKSSSTIESQREPNLQVKETTSNANKKLEPVSDNADVTHGCGIPSIRRYSFSSQESMSKEATSMVLNQSSLSSEIDCMKCITKYTSGGKRVKFSSISQKFSQIEASVPLGVPSLPIRKGILKRNPRGCRGICTCLNCAAFRLNANKAFEFSRNQMQDAEEVTLELIRELKHLRNVLEKSAFYTDYNSVASANQVKEACRNASKVEEVAMNRLRLMNYELNVHCRIPCEKRPKVRFANQVEEFLLAKSDSEQ
ncbi:hypothetical protein HS088_TW13G01387 [Tripterygium wilfordii]|uniref:Uncharacterized protein n=1 Tax=Tripterygium wilfordii TaxID=458696 RepID=A0A7J7CWU8_TRIWF|nr:uncharacterized protein LOC120012054 [Tripterygium wilfordii]KAF5738488.1 hypothetical protein HS088_TW13G01387 [Tripterygium wilfordii]